MNIDPDSKTLQLDRFLAVPMFCASMLFLVFVAAAVQEFTSETIYQSVEASLYFFELTLLMFPLFLAEALAHFWIGSPRWKTAFLRSLLPPLRLAARDHETGTTMWLPMLGWREVDDDLHEEVERAFSGPMMVVALMILPLLAISLVWHYRIDIGQYPWLEAIVETGYSITWLAFTVEFIVMFSLVDKKFAYVRKHWVDLLIICLPLVAFLRVLRVSQLLRLQQVTKATRIYRLRGLALRLWRGIVALDMLSRLMRLDPERRIELLEELITEKEEEIEKIREQISELQARIATKAKVAPPQIAPETPAKDTEAA
ncbi:hypothetical protein LOC68_12830 [Blastopirellula sp. JC732]|uniref:Potassium channel protein n=1 Tax=Blastopirellula sediminis TaxID=2894196 RepID=A0A9X1MMG1_9BACT|nr:hypothetical protein [Blastopirellula sediminis]MCC9607426.1 hypothetical protein [Blastopirellula sediminis]MCC9629281.1 hypothetical protein [Blastopirellula sediminis]